jgi:hypothetical protein
LAIANSKPRWIIQRGFFYGKISAVKGCYHPHLMTQAMGVEYRAECYGACLYSTKKDIARGYSMDKTGTSSVLANKQAAGIIDPFANDPATGVF